MAVERRKEVWVGGWVGGSELGYYNGTGLQWWWRGWMRAALSLHGEAPSLGKMAGSVWRWEGGAKAHGRVCRAPIIGAQAQAQLERAVAGVEGGTVATVRHGSGKGESAGARREGGERMASQNANLHIFFYKAERHD